MYSDCAARRVHYGIQFLTDCLFRSLVPLCGQVATRDLTEADIPQLSLRLRLSEVCFVFTVTMLGSLNNNSWCNHVLWSPQKVQKYHQEVSFPIEGVHLQLEVLPMAAGITSNHSYHFQLELSTPIRGITCLLTRGVTGKHMCGHRGMHIFAHNYVKRVEQT